MGNKVSKPVWAIPLMIILLISVYALAAFAGVLPMTAQQATDDDEDSSPTPQPTPQATPDVTSDALPTSLPGMMPDAGTPAAEAPAEQSPAATPSPAPVQDTQVEVQKLSGEQMQQYEAELNDLRERIMKSKARLMQLREQLMLGSVSIISLSILHTHEVSGAFKLETLSYTLDGFEIYTGVNTPENDLEQLENFPVYEGSMLPGEHLLVVDMVFRGRGYGIFSYLNQYLFKVKARYLFTVNEGDVVTLKVTSYDEGSFLTSLRNRLKVKFIQE